MIVKDAMVLIHLAKTTLLEHACIYFENVKIPSGVKKEIMKGKEKGFPDASIIEDMIEKGTIEVMDASKKMIDKAHQFNIQGGEAEAVALYWQEGADLLASDDDSLRSKSLILNIKLIGTPVIVLKLYWQGFIEKSKFREVIFELREIGWFSNQVIDKILLEAENGPSNRNKATG